MKVEEALDDPVSAYDTYGISNDPFYGSAGREGCTKSRTKDRRGAIFTQVRAANQHKTLLLLWFIVDVLEPRLQERS
jgi:hypothetical protein